MLNKRRSFDRPLGQKRYNAVIAVATEGSKTEPQYFAHYNKIIHEKYPGAIHIKLIPGKITNASPIEVCKRMQKYLKENPLQPGDMAIVIVDRDSWPYYQFEYLYNWEKENSHHFVCIVIPSFDRFLLNHTEKCNEDICQKEIERRLNKTHKNFSKTKNINLQKITLESIKHAIDIEKSHNFNLKKKVTKLSLGDVIEVILKKAEVLEN